MQDISHTHTHTQTHTHTHTHTHTFIISSNEAQDVLMTEHDGLVNLSLTEPGAFLSG